MKINYYARDLARIKQQKGTRSRIYALSPGGTINGYRIYGEKHCMNISVPKGNKYAFGLPEADQYGNESLVLVTAEHVNPALFGRE